MISLSLKYSIFMLLGEEATRLLAFFFFFEWYVI